MKYIIISSVLILAIFLAFLSQIPRGIEPLTELYFENHTELPKYLFLNKDYNFSFTVHNLEYTGMKYEYIINIINESGKTTFELDKKKLYLSNNESKTISENFNINKSFGRSKIDIQLNKLTSGNEINAKNRFWWKDKNYPNNITIHFWVEEITGPKIIITND